MATSDHVLRGDAATSTPIGRGAATTGRRPFLPGQSGLVWAGVLTIIGAVTPWVATIGGTFLGVQGGGMWTLAAGGMGLATVAYRRRSVVLAHAVLVTVVTLGIGGWQALRLASLGCDFRACAPSYGLVLTIAAGLLALLATRRLARGVGSGRSTP